MNQRPKNSAFLLLALVFLCIYLVKSHYSAPRLTSTTVGVSIVKPDQSGQFLSAGARLVYGLKVDINSATALELKLLPGIGPVLAGRIVEERRVKGGFNSIDELVRVKGLSPGRLKSLAPYITVGG